MKRHKASHSLLNDSLQNVKSLLFLLYGSFFLPKYGFRMPAIQYSGLLRSTWVMLFAEAQSHSHVNTDTD